MLSVIHNGFQPKWLTGWYIMLGLWFTDNHFKYTETCCTHDHGWAHFLYVDI